MPHHPLTRQTIRLGSALSAPAADPRDPAWRAWAVRVEAGLIGEKPARSFDQRLRLMRNEVAMFGRVVTPELERF